MARQIQADRAGYHGYSGAGRDRAEQNPSEVAAELAKRDPGYQDVVSLVDVPEQEIDAYSRPLGWMTFGASASASHIGSNRS